MQDLIGRSLNRYRILALLGTGGIGTVYRAIDTILQRDVAVKVMNPELAARSNFRDRFLQEARIAARLDHPSIVQVHDFGEDEGFLYIVMEYIPGDNLRKILQDLKAQHKWVILTEAVKIVQQVSQAIVYAHSQGVLHRDIKPDNLMLKPEPSVDIPYRVVLTDLGLAQLMNGKQADGEGTSMGTPAYMSPEQALGKPTDERSDVYSLGVLLYELSVGRLPFPAKTLEEAVRYHTQEPVPLPRDFRSELPLSLQDVILKAMEKDPANRYANADELSKALESVLADVTEISNAPSEMAETVSLVTQYDLTREERLDVQGEPRRSYQDFIEVLQPDKSVKRVAMKPGGLAIGRDADNDLVLESAKVSRHHARIQFDGQHYWASDLTSRNGTFLSNRRLTPGEPERWTPDKTLEIGGVFMRLIQPSLAQANVPDATNFVPGTGTDTIAASSQGRPDASSQRAGIYMETVQLSVTPGSSTTAIFILLNRSGKRDNFRITVSGIPPNWIPSPPPVLQLPPGGQQEIRLVIQPPLAPETRPGRYPISIIAYSLLAPDQPVQVDATLTVGVFSRFTSELRPRRIYSDQTVTVTVQNQGNARDTFTITPLDRYEELVFDPPQARLTLPEGQVASAEFRGMVRRRRIFGSTRTQPFSADVTTSNGQTQTVTGEVVDSGIFPPVILPLFLVLCLCLTAMAAYGYINVLGGPMQAKQTAAAETQFAAGTQAVLSIANQATIQAATQQAAIMQTQLAATLIASTLTAAPTTPGPTDTPTPTSTATPPPPSPTPTTIPPTATMIVIVVTPTPVPPTPIPPSPTPFVPTATVPANPTPAPLGGSYITVFSSARDGNYEIYAMLPNGAKQTRVTNNPGADTHPAVSPDYQHVAFVSNRDGNSQIYVMNTDGSNQTRISNNGSNDYNPSWSPDGSKIAFVSTRDGNPEIYVMNANGANQTRLTNNNLEDDHPAWSADGGQLTYDEKDPNGTARNIIVMNSDGSNQKQVLNNGAVNYEPSFSPDNSKIVYVSNKDGNNDIWVMGSDGSNPTRLTNMNTTIYSPHFSRDGTWITFEALNSGAGQIYVMKSDGSQITNVTNNSVDNADPSW